MEKYIGFGIQQKTSEYGPAMKILNWYVAKSFLATFFMAIAVLTFGMTGNNLIKVFDYVSEGVPLSSAMLFVLYAVPMALAFTIPWASLVSIMAYNGEIRQPKKGKHEN